MNSKAHQILLVEDHDDSAYALARLLRSFGHSVQTADSCRTARKLFEENVFDLLLLDLGLPDGDGCDLLQELIAIKKVPAIAITGYGMASDIQRSSEAGFISHITKPLMLTELRESLSSLKLEPHPS